MESESKSKGLTPIVLAFEDGGRGMMTLRPSWTTQWGLVSKQRTNKQEASICLEGKYQAWKRNNKLGKSRMKWFGGCYRYPNMWHTEWFGRGKSMPSHVCINNQGKWTTLSLVFESQHWRVTVQIWWSKIKRRMRTHKTERTSCGAGGDLEARMNLLTDLQF